MQVYGMCVCMDAHNLPHYKVSFIVLHHFDERIIKRWLIQHRPYLCMRVCLYPTSFLILSESCHTTDYWFINSSTRNVDKVNKIYEYTYINDAKQLITAKNIKQIQREKKQSWVFFLVMRHRLFKLLLIVVWIRVFFRSISVSSPFKVFFLLRFVDSTIMLAGWNSRRSFVVQITLANVQNYLKFVIYSMHMAGKSYYFDSIMVNFVLVWFGWEPSLSLCIWLNIPN